MQGEPIHGATAWKAADFAGKPDFSLALDATERRAVEAVLTELARRAPAESAIAAEHVRRPAIEALMRRVAAEVMQGRGFVLLQGLPIGDFDAATVGKLFLGLGYLMGRPVVQSPLGDRLGHVVDVSKPGELERGYRSSVELTPHTDSDDLVAMLCLRKARAGGRSRLVSAHSIYNAMLDRAPELLPLLYRGFAHHWFGEEAPGEAPITPYRVPVLSWQEGVLSACHLRQRCDMAGMADAAHAYTPIERRALDLFDRLALDPELSLEFQLEPGEAYFLNNYVLLHARSAFEDFERPEQRRHLLRLWVKCPGARPVAEPVLRYYGADGIPVRPERTSTAYRGPLALQGIGAG
ncbi:MAG: TauD/TfdA family dioxygenase [Dongiaceae bacterium]